MSKNRKLTIAVQGASVTVLSQNQQDIICLTDIAKYKNPDHPDDVIRNWLRNRNTVEFLGVWERLNNPAFNPVEFDGIKSGVVEPFPDAEELHGVAVAQPVADDVVRVVGVFVFGDVGQANDVLLVL